MNSLNFSKLSSTKFEEFCYDLLDSLGFVDLSWRKGTALDSSPADSGRDIECSRIQLDCDKTSFNERWFVDCKHYKKGVPPSAIQASLAWANAERPHVLLLIASGFLSNACKDFIRKYEEANRPPFRIKVWEHKEIGRLSSDKTQLLRRYSLAPELSFASRLHPAHLQFLQRMPINSFEEFFTLVEKVPSKVRDAALQEWYVAVVRPKLPHLIPQGEDALAVAWTLIRSANTWSYENFKVACKELAINKRLLVQSIVSVTASNLFAYADHSNAAEKKNAQQRLIEELDTAIRANQTKWQNMSDVFVLFGKLSIGGLDLELMRKIRDNLNEQLADFDRNSKQRRKEYEVFCETVIAPLIESDLVQLR